MQEYSEDSNSEPDVDLENQYYNSKALKEDEPLSALQSFQKVLELENGGKGEWAYMALKQMIQFNFKLLSYEKMMVRYKQLPIYITSAVTRNHSEESINAILDDISTSKNVSELVRRRQPVPPGAAGQSRMTSDVLISDGIVAKRH